MSNKEMLAVALRARSRAYAPYSGFAVGVALLTGTGRVFGGCNVENLSLGLTICAERAAVAAAVAEGEKDFVRIAIMADSAEPAVPCGACRQVLAEFNPNIKIVTSTLQNRIQEFSLSDLLPRPRQGILERVSDV
ncbi:MAG: cytidine deaminase [Chthoniobacterales bacterium]